MYGRPNNSGNPQQPPPWLVRAEVTIRHGNPVTSDSGQTPVGSTSTVTDSRGVRMICRWNTTQSTPATQTPVAVPSTGSTASTASTVPTVPPSSTGPTPPSSSYGFQRGNILFTSTPPSRFTTGGPFVIPRSGSSGNDDSISSRGRGVSVSDSGYNSEQFSPHSYSSLPTRRPSAAQQYNRRCKSTCSIVLSAVNADNDTKTFASEQTQTNNRDEGKEFSRFASPHQHVSGRYRFSTVPEVCEDCAEGSSSSAFTTHFCTRVVERTASKSTAISKDASSQTTDIESRSSSLVGSKLTRPRRKQGANTQQADGQKKKKQELGSPTTSTGTTSPIPPIAEADKSDSSKDDSAKRKSRTVHIDVYCTGSDDDVSTDSSSEEERGTPMTVYESEEVRVTHTQAADNNLPRGFEDDKAFLKRAQERRCESFKHAPMRMPSLASSKGYESDDVLSSLYPSRFSSYSALRDFDSVPWSAASSSAAIPGDDYDSAAATSSKDTFSDIESLINTGTNLTPCDSFEYASSSDRERIRKMETVWAEKEKEEKSKTWRSPQIERKHLLRNRKMREYLEKHDIGWSSGESAGDSDESGTIGWSVLPTKNDSGLTQKESTIDTSSKDTIETIETPKTLTYDYPKKNFPIDKTIVQNVVSSDENSRVSREDSSKESVETVEMMRPKNSPKNSPNNSRNKKTIENFGNFKSNTIEHSKRNVFQENLSDRSDSAPLSDYIPHSYMLRDQIGPFGSKSPSPLPSKVPSRVTSPFTTPCGEKTDHILKASIFGAVINAFRKPGHHIGPSKNPSCSCEHCRRYFEENMPRGRSRSFGELERRPGQNGRNQWQNEREIIRPAPTKMKR